MIKVAEKNKHQRGNSSTLRRHRKHHEKFLRLTGILEKSYQKSGAHVNPRLHAMIVADDFLEKAFGKNY